MHKDRERVERFHGLPAYSNPLRNRQRIDQRIAVGIDAAFARCERQSIVEALLSGSSCKMTSAKTWTRRHGLPETGDKLMLSSQQRQCLGAIANAIIPQDSGMPSAGNVHAVDYIETVLADVPQLGEQVMDALKRLNQISNTMFHTELTVLSGKKRVELLESFERESKSSAGEEGIGDSAQAAPDHFALLRDLVYEAYYTNPEIRNRLGYEFYSTNEGPEMAAFDEAILDKIRTRPRHYREVR